MSAYGTKQTLMPTMRCPLWGQNGQYPDQCPLMTHSGHAKPEMLRHATPLLFKANGLPVTMCATSRLLCRWGCRRPLRDLLLPLGFVPPVDQSPGAFCIGKLNPSLGHCGKRVSYRYVGVFEKAVHTQAQVPGIPSKLLRSHSQTKSLRSLSQNAQHEFLHLNDAAPGCLRRYATREQSSCRPPHPDCCGWPQQFSSSIRVYRSPR